MSFAPPLRLALRLRRHGVVGRSACRRHHDHFRLAGRGRGDAAPRPRPGAGCGSCSGRVPFCPNAHFCMSRRGLVGVRAAFPRLRAGKTRGAQGAPAGRPAGTALSDMQKPRFGTFPRRIAPWRFRDAINRGFEHRKRWGYKPKRCYSQNVGQPIGPFKPEHGDSRAQGGAFGKQMRSRLLYSTIVWPGQPLVATGLFFSSRLFEPKQGENGRVPEQAHGTYLRARNPAFQPMRVQDPQSRTSGARNLGSCTWNSIREGCSPGVSAGRASQRR